jgi:hypothetical protein
MPGAQEDTPVPVFTGEDLNLTEAGHLEEAGVPTLLSAVTNPVEDLMALGFTRPQVCMQTSVRFTRSGEST